MGVMNFKLKFQFQCVFALKNYIPSTHFFISIKQSKTNSSTCLQPDANEQTPALEAINFLPQTCPLPAQPLSHETSPRRARHSIKDPRMHEAWSEA